ncbi:6-hydroxymethylpterin diphosphokinase MptE-like protein [Leptospira wolffii]|uniref:6-hydroxymethylpterin diphosphokinase MptE-like protein n=1 Tax=Leptospira wolffii TaxID=409998 RepID=A0ABV5BPF3_9LEPT
MILVGVGCGYHVSSYLKTKNPATSLLLLEPFGEIESLLPESCKEEWKGHIPFFGWKNFQNLKQEAWLPPGIRSLRVIIHPNYLRRYPELSREILDFFQNRRLDRQNILAKNEYGRLWVRNFFRHLEITSRNKDKYRILAKKQSTSPDRIGCFLGASPELESEIPWIRKHRKNVFLLSSDTSLGFLLENGIRPDAILSIDSGLGTSYHFPEKIPKEIPILTWLGGSTKIFDLENPKILYLSTHPLDQILGSRYYPGAPILENPILNVAGLAVSALQALGAGAVCMKGVGFTREAGKTHCRSSGYERYDRFFLNRKRSLYSARYSPESRWKTRTVVLDSLHSWSPIPILSSIRENAQGLSGWENSLVKLGSEFPGTIPEWRNWIREIPEIPQDIRDLVPREIRQLERVQDRERT